MKLRSLATTYCLLMAACLAAGQCSAAEAPAKTNPLDWPTWRGPEQNGISRETGLPAKLDFEGGAGGNLLWKTPELAGISTPIVMRGKIYTLVRSDPDTPREAEKVVCADAATGKKIWENVFNVFLSAVPAERVGWSNCVGDPSTGRVYAQGVCGLFQCLDGETGKTIWSRSLAEEFGTLSTYGGRTATPVLFEDLVIVNSVMTGWGEFARPAQCFLALDKSTGETVWLRSTLPFPEDTTYSTPVVTTLKGQAALVVGASDGAVWAMQPRTGNPIWQFYVSRRGLNVTPVVIGDTVYSGHSEENLDNATRGAIFAIDGAGSGDITKTGEKWRFTGGMDGVSSPIVVDGRMYAADDTCRLYILDTATGQEVCPSVKLTGNIMRAGLLYADGKIYAMTSSAWHVLQPTATGVKVLARRRLTNADAVSGSPVVSHGKLYVTTIADLYCFAEPGVNGRPARVDSPTAAPETPAGANDPPAQVQVVPVEVLLKPGEKQQFTVRLFNARGQMLRTSPATFTLEGPGEIDRAGQYVAASSPAHTATIVTAKVGSLTGKARVRVVPPLPWKFDFADGRVPVTWIGARYRHVAVDFDLFQALEKQDHQSAQMYLAVMTSFTNANSDKVTYADNTPRRTWSELLRFLRVPGSEQPLETVVTSLADAKKAIDPALAILQKQKVVSKWAWSDSSGIQLAVERGERKIEGNGVMLKITTIPKGAKSQCWMGPPGLHDYTVQADVFGAFKNKKLPDMGLVAQRYTLDLMGESKQLQIRSWSSQLGRFSKSAPAEWKPGAWYTVKFRTAADDGKAVLKGKFWPRGQKEPAGWTVEATDAVANVVGSPGLYGNANDSEIFIDNVVVSSNSSR